MFQTISAKWQELILINKKKRICHLLDYSFPGDLRESEKLE